MHAITRLLWPVSGHTPAYRAAGGAFRVLQQSFGAKTAVETKLAPVTPLLIVHPASQSQYSLQEACRLAESLSGTTPDYLEVGSASRLRPSPSTFFGSGQVEAVKAHVAAVQPQRVFVNHALSGVQQRNLERALGLPVLDRVALIIEIFSQRARTSEARLQVELASLEYKASRLVRVLDAATGKRTAFGVAGDASEIVSARERGRSGAGAGGLGGAGGQGESELQLQRRRVAERRRQLLRRLQEVRRTRAVQRAARQRSGKPQVAIVGYTNAGKSSLLAALTKCGGAAAGVQDRLFATLDPTLRRVMLPGSGRDVVLSDTVGFISDLPTQLIEAFQATLEEVTEADLLLHVLDASSPQVLQQRHAVLGVLRGLGLSEERLREGVIEVWNKVDLLPEQRAAADHKPQHERQGEGVASQAPDISTTDAGSLTPALSSSSSSKGRVAAARQEASSRSSSPPANSDAPLLGHLPPAVEALLESDAAPGAYRPTAVATSVLHSQGLGELLAAVESKLQALLGSGPQRSRRSAKREAAGLLEQQEEEAVQHVLNLADREQGSPAGDGQHWQQAARR